MIAMDKLAAHLVTWLGEQVAAGGGDGVVFGLSGGIDSAVVAALASAPSRITAWALIMPCHSEPQDEEDARLVAHHFGIATATVDLGGVYDRLLTSSASRARTCPTSRLACANIKPRLRMTTLYAVRQPRSTTACWAPATAASWRSATSPSTATAASTCCRWATSPRREVRELARHLDVPRRIIAKPPSAGLWSGPDRRGRDGSHLRGARRLPLSGRRHGRRAGRSRRMNAASAHKRELPPMAPLPRRPAR